MKIIIIVMLIVSTTAAQSQDCQNILNNYIDELFEKSKVDVDKTYFVEYTTENIYHPEKGIKNTNSHTSILSSRNTLLMEDENLYIYGNSDNVVVIIPNNKKVYLGNSDPRMFMENNNYEQMIGFERALLYTAEKISCVEIDDNVLLFTILPSKNFSNKYFLLKQIIHFSLTENRILRVENSFNSKTKLSKQIVTYKTMDFNSTKTMKSPLTYLYDDGNVRHNYKGYEIIDIRKTIE